MPKPTRPDGKAAFAKAMARAEFGRFYCSDNDLREVRRSLSRKKAEGERDRNPAAPAKPKTVARPSACKGPGGRPAPRLRERRTELAEAFARLRKHKRGDPEKG